MFLGTMLMACGGLGLTATLIWVAADSAGRGKRRAAYTEQAAASVRAVPSVPPVPPAGMQTAASAPRASGDISRAPLGGMPRTGTARTPPIPPAPQPAPPARRSHGTALLTDEGPVCAPAPKFCAHCGAALPADAVFCQQCGERAASATGPTQTGR